MQVKNIGQRGWFVLGQIIAPGTTAEVECTEADIAGNGELEIVKAEEVKAKPGRPAAVKVSETE